MRVVWLLAGLLILLVSGCMGDGVSSPEANTAVQTDPAAPLNQSTVNPNHSASESSEKQAPLRDNTGEGLSRGSVAPSVSVNASHGHAEVRTQGGLHLTNLDVQPINGSWNRSIQLGDGTATLIPFLEPNRTYEITSSAELSDGRVWVNTTTIHTESSPASFVSLDEARIHPGMEIEFSNGVVCTLSFILRGPTNETLYGLTAGHCPLDGQPGSGQSVYFTPDSIVGDNLPSREPERFGYVVRGVDGDPLEDWALIAIEQEHRAEVSPSVPRWGGPTGLALASFEIGDQACFYGQAIDLSEIREARGRCGALAWFQASPPQDDGGAVIVGGPTRSGDSGAPVIHMETGQALGYLNSGLYGTSQIKTLCPVFAFIEDDIGHSVRLVPGGSQNENLPPVPGVPMSENPLSYPRTCPDHIRQLHEEL